MSSEQKLPRSKEKLEVLSEQTTATARRVGELELIVFNIARENEILKDALQLVHEKLDAVISLQSNGIPLTDENINETVVKLKEASLKERVDEMVRQGTIRPVDQIGDDSLVVSRELNQDGKVENPRLQFLVGRLVDQLKNKFVGKKVGDLIKGEEGKLDIEIIEIFDLVPQTLGKVDANNDLPLEDGTDEEQSES